MKRSVRLGIGATLLMSAVWIAVTRAATETEKVGAIQKGLAYLDKTQEAGGFWKASGYEHAATGAAAFTLLSQQSKWGQQSIAYQAAVDKAMAYLVSTAHSSDVTTRNDGVSICPGGSVSCKAVYWYDTADSTYTTGLVAPAIAAYGAKLGASVVATTSGPLAGMTWGQIAQGITNAFAVSQSTSENGNKEGGWRGFPGNGDADSAATQLAVISLLYDEALGASTPQAVKDELKVWLANVQNASGAVCFQPGTEPCDHANTGGWLLAMRFVGYDLAHPPVQAALNFLNANWQSTANNIWYGNFGHPNAMWAVYHGLEANVGLNDTTHITNLLTDCGAATNKPPGDPADSVPCTWSDDYNEWLSKNQRADGSWAGYSYWTAPIATAFSLDILAGTQVPSLPLQNGTSATAQGSLAPPSRLQTRSVAPFAPPTQLTPAVATPLPSVGNQGHVRSYERKGVSGLAVNGNAVASGSSTDNRIRIFDASTGQQLVVLEGSLGVPIGLGFSPDGTMLTSVGRDSLVRVWNAATGSELAELTGHENAIRAVAVSPDGRYLATAGEETRIMLWDLTSRKLSQIFFGATDFVNAASFSPDSRLLALGGEDARALIFDVANGKILHTLLGHSGAINAVAFSPDGSLLASAGQDTVIHVWDPGTGVQRQALTGHQAPIRSIAFSPDGHLLASGGEDSQVILWNPATGAISKTLLDSPGVVNVLSFSSRGNGNFLASASEAGEVTLWNVIAGVKMRTIPVP